MHSHRQDENEDCSRARRIMEFFRSHVNLQPVSDETPFHPNESPTQPVASSQDDIHCQPSTSNLSATRHSDEGTALKEAHDEGKEKGQKNFELDLCAEGPHSIEVCTKPDHLLSTPARPTGIASEEISNPIGRPSTSTASPVSTLIATEKENPPPYESLPPCDSQSLIDQPFPHWILTSSPTLQPVGGTNQQIWAASKETLPDETTQYRCRIKIPSPYRFAKRCHKIRRSLVSKHGDNEFFVSITVETDDGGSHAATLDVLDTVRPACEVGFPSGWIEVGEGAGEKEEEGTWVTIVFPVEKRERACRIRGCCERGVWLESGLEGIERGVFR